MTMERCYVCLVFLFSLLSLQLSTTSALRVLVTGATGNLGRLVVKELSSKPDTEVVACVRNEEKATEIFGDNKAVTIKVFDLEKTRDISTQLCDDVDHVIWTAAGSVQTKQDEGLIDKFLNIFRGEKEPIDKSAVREICRVLGKRERGKFVMCSSAGVSRPTWSDDKKQRLIGCSDIPIVRLNPGNILGTKLESEELVRNTKGLDYCVVRPCGLNDNHPSGRPLLSQGDVAVGRINRQDVASLLVDILFEKASSGKTFEAIAIPEYPKPASYAEQLNRFRSDAAGGVNEDEVDATYAIMQQLVPGEQLAPQKLAMGQTYEQLDKGETGRLGERGKEVLPTRLGGDNEPNSNTDVGIKKENKPASAVAPAAISEPKPTSTSASSSASASAPASASASATNSVTEKEKPIVDSLRRNLVPYDNDQKEQEQQLWL